MVLPQLAPALAAGVVLCVLSVFGDFGVVSILRYDALVPAIHRDYRASFDRTGAVALSAVLVLVMLVVVAAESRMRGWRRRQRGGAVAHARVPVALGRWRGPALALCAGLVAVTLVLPVLVLLVWALHDGGARVGGSLTQAAGNSVLTALAATAIALVVAVPVVRLGATRKRTRALRVIEGAHYTGYALPQLVVALAIVYAARGMGSTSWEVLRTVVAPLARPGVVAAAALVFVFAMKELPALLLLAPTGLDTLSTLLWRQANHTAFHGAAGPALLLILLSVPALVAAVRHEER